MNRPSGVSQPTRTITLAPAPTAEVDAELACQSAGSTGRRIGKSTVDAAAPSAAEASTDGAAPGSTFGRPGLNEHPLVTPTTTPMISSSTASEPIRSRMDIAARPGGAGGCSSDMDNIVAGHEKRPHGDAWLSDLPEIWEDRGVAPVHRA